MTEGDLITVREAARACNRSEETIRRWIWSGRLPSRKLGNQHFISRSDLDAMMAPRAAEAKAAYVPRPSPSRSGTAAEGGLPDPAAFGRTEPLSEERRALFSQYDYSPSMEDIRGDRGQLLPGPEDEARNIAADEALQREIVQRFGRVDVVRLLRRVRGG